MGLRYKKNYIFILTEEWGEVHWKPQRPGRSLGRASLLQPALRLLHRPRRYAR